MFCAERAYLYPLPPLKIVYMVWKNLSSLQTEKNTIYGVERWKRAHDLLYIDIPSVWNKTDMTASLRSAVAATLPKGKIYFLQTGEVPKIYSSGLSGVSRFFYFQRFFIINGISIFCKHLYKCTNHCQINNDKMEIYGTENNFKKF